MKRQASAKATRVDESIIHGRGVKVESRPLRTICPYELRSNNPGKRIILADVEFGDHATIAFDITEDDSDEVFDHAVNGGMKNPKIYIV